MATSPDIEAALISEAAKAGAHRLVVGAVIEVGGQVLLLRRKEQDFMGGIFELPSGRVEEGETLGGALAREVAEETGLYLTGFRDFLGAFDYISGEGSLTRQLNFRVALAGKVKVVLSEHDGFLWAGPDTLDDLGMTDSTRSIVRRHFENSG